MESSDSINEAENDLQVLLEKQDMHNRALTMALEDSLNNLGFALDNSVLCMQTFQIYRQKIGKQIVLIIVDSRKTLI